MLFIIVLIILLLIIFKNFLKLYVYLPINLLLTKKFNIKFFKYLRQKISKNLLKETFNNYVKFFFGETILSDDFDYLLFGKNEKFIYKTAGANFSSYLHPKNFVSNLTVFEKLTFRSNYLLKIIQKKQKHRSFNFYKLKKISCETKKFNLFLLFYKFNRITTSKVFAEKKKILYGSRGFLSNLILFVIISKFIFFLLFVKFKHKFSEIFFKQKFSFSSYFTFFNIENERRRKQFLRKKKIINLQKKKIIKRFVRRFSRSQFFFIFIINKLNFFKNFSKLKFLNLDKLKLKIYNILFFFLLFLGYINFIIFIFFEYLFFFFNFIIVIAYTLGKFFFFFILYYYNFLKIEIINKFFNILVFIKKTYFFRIFVNTLKFYFFKSFINKFSKQRNSSLLNLLIIFYCIKKDIKTKIFHFSAQKLKRYKEVNLSFRLKNYNKFSFNYKLNNNNINFNNKKIKKFFIFNFFSRNNNFNFFVKRRFYLFNFNILKLNFYNNLNYSKLVLQKKRLFFFKKVNLIKSIPNNSQIFFRFYKGYENLNVLRDSMQYTLELEYGDPAIKQAVLNAFSKRKKYLKKILRKKELKLKIKNYNDNNLKFYILKKKRRKINFLKTKLSLLLFFKDLKNLRSLYNNNLNNNNNNINDQLVFFEKNNMFKKIKFLNISKKIKKKKVFLNINKEFKKSQFDLIEESREFRSLLFNQKFFKFSIYKNFKNLFFVNLFSFFEQSEASLNFKKLFTLYSKSYGFRKYLWKYDFFDYSFFHKYFISKQHRFWNYGLINFLKYKFKINLSSWNNEFFINQILLESFKRRNNLFYYDDAFKFNNKNKITNFFNFVSELNLFAYYYYLIISLMYIYICFNFVFIMLFCFFFSNILNFFFVFIFSLSIICIFFPFTLYSYLFLLKYFFYKNSVYLKLYNKNFLNYQGLYFFLSYLIFFLKKKLNIFNFSKSYIYDNLFIFSFLGKIKNFQLNFILTQSLKLNFFAICLILLFKVFLYYYFYFYLFNFLFVYFFFDYCKFFYFYFLIIIFLIFFIFKFFMNLLLILFICCLKNYNHNLMFFFFFMKKIVTLFFLNNSFIKEKLFFENFFISNFHTYNLKILNEHILLLFKIKNFKTKSEIFNFNQFYNKNK